MAGAMARAAAGDVPVSDNVGSERQKTSEDENEPEAADESESSEAFSEFSEGETSTPVRNRSATIPAAVDFDVGQQMLVN